MAPPHIVAEMQAMKEQMDVMMNALKGRVSSDLDDLVHRTDSPFTASSQLLPPSTKVPYAANGKLRWKQRPSRSFGVFQDPNALSGGTRRDHMQSFPHHAEGSRKDMV